MRDADLRRAIACGLTPWAVVGLGTVEVVGGWLRYDPALPARSRAILVLAALAEKNRAPRT